MSDPLDPVGDEEPRARAVLAAVADPRLLERLDRRARAFDGRVRLPAPSPSLPVHVEPADWRTGFLRVNEREIPGELTSDLQELTPQASLRDLFRPVMQSVWHEREPMTEALDPGGRRAWATLRESRRVPRIPRVTPTVLDVATEQLRRRAWVAERWQPAMPDAQPRREVTVHRDPSLIA